jgi:hypothetical protein
MPETPLPTKGRLSRHAMGCRFPRASVEEENCCGLLLLVDQLRSADADPEHCCSPWPSRNDAIAGRNCRGPSKPRPGLTIGAMAGT